MLNPSNLENISEEQLKRMRALSDPLRIKVLMKLFNPMTVTEIAKSLDVDRNSLYYHIRILLKNKLIEKVETHQVGHLTESVYKIVDGLVMKRYEDHGPFETYRHLVVGLLQETLDDCVGSLSQEKEVKFGGGRTVIKVKSENLSKYSLELQEKAIKYLDEVKAMEEEDGDANFSITIVQFETEEK